MGTMEFWKCYPDKFLIGVRGLSLEECGAYSIVLQLIYATDNKLLDDDFEMCGSLHCNTKVWRRIKATLIEKGKIYVENGHLMNTKATSTIVNALENSAKVSELNRVKGIKSGIARKKRKELDGVVEQSVQRELVPLEGPDEVVLAVEQYNIVAQDVGGVICQKLTSARRTAVKARLKDCGGLSGWEIALAKARASPWCRGEVSDFRLSLDFLCQLKSFTCLMEGKYDDRKSKSSNRSAATFFDKLNAELDEREREGNQSDDNGVPLES